MSDTQLNINNTVATVASTRDKLIDVPIFDLPENYSILINKLERLALGLDSAFGNLSLDHKELEVAVSGSNEFSDLSYANGGPFAAGRAPPPRAAHHMEEAEYSRVVSDIWIGVVLTLLIVSVIFFICSCFLYHKFQQWKNSYRSNPNEPVEICRHYPDFEVESLPSYTIVSGLPTYDDALEEFRKAGIILAPHIPIVKIFEKDTKENQIYNLENGGIGIAVNQDNADNISLSSTCTCGATSAANATVNCQNNTNNLNLNVGGAGAQAQVIELSPEQLAQLSQKRLSLQIAFNNSVRRNSRPRIDLYRQANRNNALRSQRNAIGHNFGGAGGVTFDAFPPIHRSSSSSSLSLSHEPNTLLDSRRLQHLQHRGSLC